MAWAASSIRIIAEQGWGAVLFVAIIITCFAILSARAGLPILMYFKPRAPHQATHDRTAHQESERPVTSNQDSQLRLALLHIFDVELIRLTHSVIEKCISAAPESISSNGRKHELDLDSLKREAAEFDRYCEENRIRHYPYNIFA
jgi:hypothetical protein